MNRRTIIRRLFIACLAMLLPFGMVQAQILANVGGLEVSDADLDAAIASSPMAVQFPSMDPEDQASLRGDMLKRIVAARLLYLEAKHQGLDKSQSYLEEAESYRQGYLYRAYMAKLRDGIKIDAATIADWQESYQGQNDALVAARSQEVAKRYKLLKAMTLEFLKEKYHLKVFESRLAAGAPAETVLATADDYALTLGQLQEVDEAYNQELLEERLYRTLELALVTRAAADDGIEVPMDAYAEDALPSLLLAQQEKRWIPDEAVMRSYYESHHDIGEIPERRNIVQLVVDSRELADSLRERIVDGTDTIYQLAAQHSIDPYGRKHAGDMGWLPAGSGMPQIEAVLAGLNEGEVSEVIETPRGFHLVMVEGRTPAKQHPFEAVKDRVRQAMVNEHYPAYLAELQKRFPVEWNLPMATDDESAQALTKQ